MKKWAIAGGLLAGVAILPLLWIFRAPPYRLRLVEQKVDNGRGIAVFRLDARTRHRVNLGQVKICRLDDAGKFLDEQGTLEWFGDDPRGIYFRDHTEFAMMAPTNCNQWSMSVELRPEVSARLSLGMIKGACRLRSLEPIRQSWNLNVWVEVMLCIVARLLSVDGVNSTCRLIRKGRWDIQLAA